MKSDITRVLMEEHKLILRMIALLEKNAPETAAGRYRNWQFYRDAIDFIRSFADRFHHAKEEDILFASLLDNGMPKEHSPVAAMLMEHDQGRGFVRSMEVALAEAEAGISEACRLVAANALAYSALLRDHIDKEDTILYPLAERVIPEEKRFGILLGYEAAHGQAVDGFSDDYEAVVARYEQE